MAAEAAELAGDVGAGAALAALDRDARFERLEHADKATPIDGPALLLALIGPVGEVAMAAAPIAAAASGHFVLEP